MNISDLLKFIILAFLSFCVIIIIPLILKHYPKVRKKLKISLIAVFILFLMYYAINIFGVPIPSKYLNYVHVIFIIGISISLFKILSILIFDVIIEKRRKVAVPTLLKDLINLLGYVIIVLVVAKVVLQWELTPVLATSAVVTVILGFALQDTLGNFFSGLAIHFEPPFQIGDWIKTGNTIGKVQEITWRSVKLITKYNDTIVIPNSAVAKEIIINYSQPSNLHAHSMTIGISYSDPPEKVINTIIHLLRTIPEVSPLFEPVVKIISCQDSSMLYDIKFWYTDYTILDDIVGEIYKRLWYALERESITIPFPTRTIYFSKKEKTEEHINDIIANLKRVYLFHDMEDEELHVIALAMSQKDYASKEIIVKQGEQGGSMYIIKDGLVSIEIETPSGQKKWIKDLKHGDFFGEISLLTGEKRNATIEAKSEVELYELRAEQLKAAIKEHKNIALKLESIMMQRKEEIMKAIEDETMVMEESIKDEKGFSAFIDKIKNFLFN